MSKDKKEKKKVLHHTVSFPIRHVDGFAHPCDAFDKRFRIMQHIHNVLVNEANSRLVQLFSDKQYCALVQKYHRIKDKLTDAERKEYVKVLSTFTSKYGLSGKYSLAGYVKKVRNQYKENISARQGQAEAERVMDGVAKILYSSGEHLHFKKYSQIHSIVQNDTENGIKYNIHTQHGTWNGLRFWCPIDYSDPYIAEALLSDICYYRIKRRMFPSGYRYYLEIVLKDKAPQKIIREECSTGNGGVDMGTSTIAFVSDNNVLLERLAPEVSKYNHDIKRLQKQADKLNRSLNPQYFKADGTVIKKKKYEKREWKSSRKLRKLRRMIATLYRKKSEYIRQSHYIVANKIITSCGHVYYEKVSVSGWVKRSKKPVEKSDKTVKVVNKTTGTIKTIQKNKRKKRWGKSVNDHAPSECEMLIKQKCIQYGIPFDYTHTNTMRASQYNPVTGEFKKAELSTRIKNIDGHLIQRDLLSAYVTSNPNSTLDFPDSKMCYDKFESFLKMHDKLIKEMKETGISFKQCFGF